MTGLWHDVRFGFRILTKQHRQFALVALLILAAGVGATTAVFSVVNAVLLRPLPYEQPRQLVAIAGVVTSPTGTQRRPVVPLTDIGEWRARSRSFASMGGFAYTQLPVRHDDRSFLPVTALMDPQFLPTLGNSLHLGTFFDPDAKAGADMTAILSHALWMEMFGGSPSALGRPIFIDGAPYSVRGVLAADFQFPRSDASYYTAPVALMIPASSFKNFPLQSRQWFGIGRLASGVSRQQAEAELQGIAAGLAKPTAAGQWSIELASLADETTRATRRPLIIVLGISVVLLLIAATNLMNLFFSRGSARVREMSIRRAIGSSMARIVRQLLVESLLLATAGGALGVLLAAFALEVIVALSPFHLPTSGSISIDRTVLLFTIGVSAAAALAAGLFPAIRLGFTADEALRSPGMRASAGRAVTRLQQGLCAFQIALGVALLAVAGLLAHSLWRLNVVDPGYNADEVIGFNLSVPNDQSLDDRKQFYARALDEVRTIPGVLNAGLISFLPPETRAGVFMGVSIDGVAPVEPDAPRVANTLVSSVNYFATMQMQMVQGRDFADTDAGASPPIIIVNEAFVRRHLPTGNPLGRRVGTGFDGLRAVREIVGVVADTHDRGLGAQPIPTVYIPFQQFALPYSAVAVRTRLPMASVVPVVRDRLTRLNPAVPLTDFQRVDERIHESLREPRFYTLLAATCALMAVFFVSFGLYGLVSYSVSRRTSELGIRMAVGANRRAILGMVLIQGLKLSVIGVLAGLLIAFVGTRALRAQLFQVQPMDPLTLTLAATIVIAVTLVASYAPAHRASRVSPLTALRHE